MQQVRNFGNASADLIEETLHALDPELIWLDQPSPADIARLYPNVLDIPARIVDREMAQLSVRLVLNSPPADLAKCFTRYHTRDEAAYSEAFAGEPDYVKGQWLPDIGRALQARDKVREFVERILSERSKQIRGA